MPPTITPQLSHFMDDEHAHAVGVIFGSIERDPSKTISNAHLRVDGDGNFINEVCATIGDRSYRIRIDVDF